LERPEHKRLNDYCRRLKKEEEIAVKSKVHIWEYGNVSDDDEEPAPQARGPKRGPTKPAPAAKEGASAGAPAKAGPAGNAKPAAKNPNLNKFDGRPPKRVV